MVKVGYGYLHQFTSASNRFTRTSIPSIAHTPALALALALTLTLTAKVFLSG